MAGGLQFDPTAQFFRKADTGRISGSAKEFLPRRSGLINGGTSLWHKMKYELMGFKTRNAKTLEEDVCKILAGFGKDYGMTFC